MSNTIPPLVAKLLPPAQLDHVTQYISVYAEAIDRLTKTVSTIPHLSDHLGETASEPEPPPYLHYSTGTTHFYISEYDGDDTFYGKVRNNMHPPDNIEYRKISLSNLKSNTIIELTLS